MSDPVVLRRYILPSIKGEGWAVVVIGSDGYFSVVSDWGNYAYLWSHAGCEFRKFLVNCTEDYIWSKLTQGRESYIYDREKTEQNIRERLNEMLAEGEISQQDLETALEELEDSALADGQWAIQGWASTLTFSFNYFEGIYATKRESTSWAFATKVFPRIQEVLRLELAAEASKVET